MFTSKNGTVLQSGKYRVLVVDNDPITRADHLKNLAKWGYGAVAAEGWGHSLLEDAVSKGHKHRCHLALIDMRLLDDEVLTDVSGLDLITRLSPTTAIVVTGYGDATTARMALKDRGAYDFIGKEEGPDRLRTVIREAVSTKWAGHHELRIQWPFALDSSKLVSRFFSDAAEVPPDEIDVLLQLLFPDVRQLKLDTLGGETRTPSMGIRPHSIILKATPDGKQPFVVKISRSDHPTDEVQRFTAHVEEQFPRRHYASLKGHAQLWDVQGATYEHVDIWGPMVLFSDYYERRSAEEIRCVIERFGDAWKEHYHRTRRESEPGKSLFQAYSEVWGKGWTARLKDSPDPLPTFKREFQEWYRGQGLEDPVGWVRRHVSLDGNGHSDVTGSLADMYVADLHGDLHGDNCFVDPERKDLWVIDYERSGPSPIFADWVELETDILTRLAQIQTREEFRDLAARVVAPMEVVPFTTTDGINKDLEKTLVAVGEIRRQASLIAVSRDARHYLWGLLLNAIFRLTLEQRKTHSGDKKSQTTDELTIEERCLLLGGIICLRLRNWGKEIWHPKEWTSTDPHWGSWPVAKKTSLELKITLSGQQMTFELNGGGMYTHQAVGKKDLLGTPRDILQHSFDLLSGLARKSPETRLAEERQADEETLIDIGCNLYDDLFPNDFKREYSILRRNYVGEDLLIVTDDPWIPWEVARPGENNPQENQRYQDPPLCERFSLARWLSGPAAPTMLNLSRVVIVQPSGQLEAAKRELSFLSNLPRLGVGVSKATPVCDVAGVLDSFRSSSANLYHFACHGNFDQTDPNESKLRLADGFLRANQITGDKQSGLLRAKPLVFLNTCYSGDLGYGLTRLGGWAQRFIASGASAFIGNLWAVHDELAATFAIEFYSRLFGLGGYSQMTLGRAFHDARLVIRDIDPANPTWLAYVLYGNPNARLSGVGLI